jgi:hypothetical protein
VREGLRAHVGGGGGGFFALVDLDVAEIGAERLLAGGARRRVELLI